MANPIIVNRGVAMVEIVAARRPMADATGADAAGVTRSRMGDKMFGRSNIVNCSLWVAV